MRREHKIRVWRCIAFVGLFLCFLLGLGVGAHAQNANDILGKAAAAYENSNGISASFTMFTRSAGQNAGESFEGTIQMKWYDAMDVCGTERRGERDESYGRGVTIHESCSFIK